MALTCPVDLDTARLRNEVQGIYARVAATPDGEFHFHRGAEYARSFLRYDAQEAELVQAHGEPAALRAGEVDLPSSTM